MLNSEKEAMANVGGGPPGWVLNPVFPWQNRPYPEIPIKFFDFPDPELSSSSSRRVFLFSTESLFKTVIIMQLPKVLYKDMIGA